MATYMSGQQSDILSRLMRGDVFEDCTFRQLALDGHNLTGIRLERSQFERCGLASTRLEGGRLDNCRLSNTSMRMTKAARTAWVDARVRLCDMAGTILHEACLNGSRFDESLMVGTDFDGAVLTGCEFDICDMMNASFNGALLMRCKFRDARLGNPNLMSARFEGAQLIDVDLRDANLQYASLRNALLVRVHLQGANLQGADLEGATFIEVKGLPDEVVNMQSRVNRQGENFVSRPAARGVDVQLDRALDLLTPASLARVSRETLRTYVIEAAGALLSEDRVSALMRQRSLNFADLMRFLKEHFPHEELGQVLVEGEAVFLRTPAGDVPLTRYGGGGPGVGGRAAPPPSGPSSSPMPRPSASPMPTRPGDGPGRMEPMRDSAPPPAAPPPSNASQPSRAPANEDSFEPDRFGMIDI